MRPALYVLFLAALCSLAACNSGSNTGTSGNDTASSAAAPQPSAPASSKLNADGTARLLSLVSEYYALKDAFVATDAAQVATAARSFRAMTDSFALAAAADSNLGASLRPAIDILRQNTDAILAINDQSCEQQRIPFEKVSDQLFDLLKTADLKNAGVYRQHCPMAFNDKGAYWLSGETEIRNPYFGDKMLECGEVTDSLR